MSGRNLLVFGLVLLAVGAGSFWVGTTRPHGGIENENAACGKVSIVVRNEIENIVLINTSVEFSAGETVFDALSKVARVEYNFYPGLGKFVTSIDNLRQTEAAWWLYYVNGTLASIAADRYGLMDGDNILWKYTSEMPF